MFLTLLCVGVILLVIEMMIPGFGVFGISGLACLLGALFLYLGATGEAAMIVGALLFFTVVLGVWFFKKGPHSRLGKQITLGFRSTTDKGYTTNGDLRDLVGKQGVAETPLRPSGRIIIDDEPVDAISRGEFYEAGTPVRVIAVEGRRIVVEKEEV
jgi:membrane-bound ClpP family serine protease